MLGKRRREITELQAKGRAFDSLMRELNSTEIKVMLNGMPLVIIDLNHALMLLQLNGEMEICKTHGSARVDARLIRNRKYGIMEEATAKEGTAP